MTKLPEKGLLDGTKIPETTTGEFRLAMGNIRQFLFELFGDESSDKKTARKTLGIDLNQLNDGIASKANKQTVEAALEEKADKNDLSLVATTGDYNHLVNKPEKSDTLEGYGIIADNMPTAGSTRPVTSEGIKNYVDHKATTIPHGMQVFTQSGTFVVPEGVTRVFSLVVGGGGGAGFHASTGSKWYGGGAGGTTSFGEYLTATGGGGYQNNTPSGGVPNGIAGRSASRGFLEGPFLNYFGAAGYSGHDNSISGGSGGADIGCFDVTPGKAIVVTVGTGGATNSTSPVRNGGPGICVIGW